MAKMKIAELDRPKVKAECLRLMVTIKLDRARMRLISSFVDPYLSLNESEDVKFNRSLSKAKLLPEQREEVVEIVTSWERKGIEIGLHKGRLEGRQEGHRETIEALQAVLLDVLTTRFGQPDQSTTDHIRTINSVEELKSLTHQALTANSLRDFGL